MTFKLGVFGGTFDPVHVGHLHVAEQARDFLSLDRVLFVPNRVSPFKTDRDLTPPHVRAQMVRLAVADNDAFDVYEGELNRPGPSYTVETLRAVRAEFPDAELYLLTGMDTLSDFAKWREPEAILDLARIAAAARPGSDRDAVLQALPATWVERVTFIEMPTLDISATALRTLVRQGRSVRYLTPRPVETFLREQGIYRPNESERE